ncbi:hypothetical protein LLEC1_07787, partial [Akanthomyces lecanii]
VQPVVDEGALGELAGLGVAYAGGGAGCGAVGDGAEDGLDGGGAAVDMQLQNVLTRHGGRGREVENERFRVEHDGRCVAAGLWMKQRANSGIAWLWDCFGRAQTFVYLKGVRRHV